MKTSSSNSEPVHVFYVHSYIPALLTEAIIAKYEIEASQVIIWISRNRGCQWLDFGGTIRDLDREPFRLTRLSRSWNLWKTWNEISIIDEEIASSVGGRKYHLYIPHSFNQFLQLASTHHLCTGFSYLEEGVAAYRSNEEIQVSFSEASRQLWQLSTVQRYAFRTRIQGAQFYNLDADKAYGLTSHSFGEVALPKIELAVQWKQDSSLAATYDDCALLLLAPLQPAGVSGADPDAYLGTLKQVAQILENSPFRRIYIRPHPEPDPREAIEIFGAIFQRLGDRVSIDSLAHPAEKICASARVTIISAGSSVALYAPLLGCEVLSFASILAENCRFFRQRWNSFNRAIGFPGEEHDIRSCNWAQNR